MAWRALIAVVQMATTEICFPPPFTLTRRARSLAHMNGKELVPLPDALLRTVTACQACCVNAVVAMLATFFGMARFHKVIALRHFAPSQIPTRRRA